MKRPADLVSRLFPGIALSLALTGAGCGFAVATEGPVDGARPEPPDLIPEPPDYVPDPDGISRLRTVEDVLRQSNVRGTVDGGNADGVHGCIAGRYDHYEHGGEANGTQLHVIGLYASAESYAGSGDPLPLGPVDVTINRPGKSVLVFSAHAPTQWNIHLADGAAVERIILSGWYEQTVDAPEDVPVLRYTYVEDGEFLSNPPTAWPSYDATDLVDAAEILTGLELTSFRGCSASASFQIDEPGELRPPHPESPSTKPGIIAGCEAITAESTYCMVTSVYEGATMLGLDSGTTCGNLPMNFDDDTLPGDSLAWLGDYLYMCLYMRGLARISIIDGSVDIAPLYCVSVTSHDGDLLAEVSYDTDELGYMPNYLMRFSSFADVVSRDAEEIYAMDPTAHRITTGPDRVYIAAWSTSTFEAAELADGAALQTVEFEGYDDWINGMEILPDGRLVVGGGSSTSGDLQAFDPVTGAFLGELGTVFANRDHRISGIECVSGGAAE